MSGKMEGELCALAQHSFNCVIETCVVFESTC